MIINQKVRGFIQQISPRKKFDEQAKKYTDELDLVDGQKRFTAIVAVAGDREPIRVTIEESKLLEAFGTTEVVGHIIELDLVAKVQPQWVKAEEVRPIA